MSLNLCLWVGLCVLMWDADDVFMTVVGAYVVSLILWLPAAFCIGLIMRYAELLWDAATWIGDRWRYRRCGVPRASGDEPIQRAISG